MNNKLNIEISPKAYDNLIYLLKNNKEYNCVKFTSSCTCNKATKVSIVLDNLSKDYIQKTINNLPIEYDKTLPDKLSKIELIYKENSFFMKCTLTKNNTPNTSSCTSCNSCNSCNKTQKK